MQGIMNDWDDYLTSLVKIVYFNSYALVGCQVWVKHFYLIDWLSCLFLFRPGESRFREKWLKDIFESKVQLFSNIDF